MKDIHKKWRKQAGINQAGMASILFTMVALIVISLLIFGFTSISVREQSDALDQQLGTQAFYAAESGVNDASQVIKTAVANGQSIPAKTDCRDNGGTPYLAGPVWLNPSGTVGYTCLLVNPAPNALQYNIPDGSDIVAPIAASSPYDSIQVSWNPATTANPLSGCPTQVPNSFEPSNQWTCQYAALRVDLTPTAGALTRNGLITNTLSAVLEPYNGLGAGANQISYSTNTNKATSSTITPAVCDNNLCTAVITNLGGQTAFMMRIETVYQPSSNVTITLYNGSTRVPTTNAEVLVDATGEAHGVLRRVEVALPITSSGMVPGFAVQSNGEVCKRFSVTPGYFNVGTITNADSGNAMCSVQSSGTPGT